MEAILSANPELDVTDYKMGMVIVIPSDTAENQEIAPAETIGFNPVSYTHLDVYKRQDHDYQTG